MRSKSKIMMIFRITFVCSVLTLVLSRCESIPTDDLQTTVLHTLPVSPVLIPLEPGAVQPEGWLRDWAETAAAGITGHLDERTATFGKGWSGETFEARGAGEEGTGWPLEQSAYWLDGLVRLAYILDDQQLIAKARSRLDPVVDGVLNGGPSFIFWRPKDQLEQTFDNWAHSHMGRALVAYYAATKNPRILEALIKVYEEFPLPVMKPTFTDVNGAVNLDAMLETYMLSGQEKLKATAAAFTARQDFTSVAEQWLSGDLSVGHSVIYYENIRVPALAYLFTGNKQHLDATVAALDWGERHHGLPLGLVSGEEYMAGTGSTRNVETCDVAAGAWTINWLLRITGKGAYADRLERIFFNAGPAPVSSDFQTMCYYQSPNRFSTTFPKDAPKHPSNKRPGWNSYEFTGVGHDVLCCVGNANRIIPNYIMHMWMKTNDEGLAAALYGPSILKTEVRGSTIVIQSQTDYPFGEVIVLQVTAEQPTAFPLHVRIPVWCDMSELSVNNEPITLQPGANGFASINRTWKTGDVLVLKFPMHVKILQGRETQYPDIKYFQVPGNRRIAQSRQVVNNPFASVLAGPLLFALPIPDNGPNEVKSTVPYNYALAVLPENPAVSLQRSPVKQPWSWDLEHSPVTVQVPAIAFDWQPDDLHPLPPDLIASGKRDTIDLVPYGVTKFRMSMFPVAKESWRMD